MVDPVNVYPESCLARLEYMGIAYDASVPILRVITHAFWTAQGNPHGNLRVPRLMTPKEVMAAAAAQKLSVRFNNAGEDRLIIGALLIDDLWSLVRLDDPPAYAGYRHMAAAYAAAIGGAR